MESNHHTIAIAQALQNAYVGTAVISRMAKHQNKRDLVEKAQASREECKVTLQEYRDGSELPLSMVRDILDQVSLMARKVWSPLTSDAGERLSVRLVNDIALAESHFQTQGTPAGKDIGPIVPISEMLQLLDGDLRNAPNPESPFQKMLADQSRDLVAEGLQAATELHAWFDAGASRAQQGIIQKWACTVDRLPESRIPISGEADLESWLIDVATAGALPHESLLYSLIDACEAAPAQSYDFLNAFMQGWCGRFINLPSEWVESAAKTLVNALTGTALETMDGSAADNIRSCVARVMNRKAEKDQTLSRNQAKGQSLEELVSRRFKLLEELKQVDSAIDGYDEGGSQRRTN